MKYQNIPQPQDVLRELDPTIIPLVYQGLEDGASHARAYFDQHQTKFDPFVASNLVRYRARLHLQSSGQAAQFRMEELTNNGLLVDYGMYRIRILKSDHGDVPGPGRSHARQNFWSQVSWLQPELPLGWGPVFFQQRRIHLLLVWDVTPRYNIKELVLACPKKGSANTSATELYWTWPIPHPAETIQTAGWTDGTSIDDLDISRSDTNDIDDLDISRADDDEENEDRAAQ